MVWDVEYNNEFLDWWNGITEAEQESVSNSVKFSLLKME